MHKKYFVKLANEFYAKVTSILTRDEERLVSFLGEDRIRFLYK